MDRAQDDIILVRFDRLFGGNYTCFRKKIVELANNVDFLRNVEDMPKTQNPKNWMFGMKSVRDASDSEAFDEESKSDLENLSAYMNGM